MSNLIEISKEANQNYLCKIIKIDRIEKHPNADRLQTTIVDFQTIITGMDAKVGDYYVYFPVECKINSDFLSATNSFRDSTLNVDKTAKGFFEANRRVRAMKLRGENSCGYIVSVTVVEEFCNCSGLSQYEGQYCDTINGIKMLEKYVVRERNSNQSNGTKAKVSKESMIVENQFRFSVDVANLRRNIGFVTPETLVSCTKKFHGTNFVASHVLINRNLNIVEKLIEKMKSHNIFTKFLPEIKKHEYGYIFSSRKVIKTVESENIGGEKNHFYSVDLWTHVGENEIKGKLPQGFSIFCEICGYVPETTSFIQKGYDYGCREGNYAVYVFRVTYTNPEGTVFNLNTLQAQEFCKKVGLNFVDIYFYGKAKDMFPEIEEGHHWNENFLKKLEETYLEGYDDTCKSSKAPFEGVVIRKEENPFDDLEIWKLKSFLFLQYESVELDKGEENIEDVN